MWRLNISAALAVALMLAPTSHRSAERDETPNAEIRAFLNQFVTAFNNLDWPAFIGMFEDEATVFYPSPPNAPIRATGRAEFEPAWRRVFEGIRGSRTTPPFMDLHPERLQVQMLDGAAVVTFELDDAPGVTGRRTLVLRRSHGAWRIAHLHASNVPATPPN
jgi:ketosteroid isomerase-like protein